MNKVRLGPISALIVALLIVGAGIVFWKNTSTTTTGSLKETPKTKEASPSAEQPNFEKKARSDLEVVVEGLSNPWALAFLPDDSLIFSERSGSIKLIQKGGAQLKSLGTIDQVAGVGEGGLLGLAVHPDFNINNQLYVYHTYRAEGRLFNRVVRYRLDNSELRRDKVILDKIPGATNHNGGRIKFGPDRLLYITTGDAQEPALAQDKSSLAGKILRVSESGDIPKTNPFADSPVYSSGHRNPQGIAWDSNNQLWATEHGSTAHDEVNLIVNGGNYGWPTVTGAEQKPGLTAPVIQSGFDTWAPSGAAFLDDTLLFAGLRGEALISFKPPGPGEPDLLLSGKFGRLRDVVVGPDDFIYLATSNRDGRGRPTPTDDRIIKVGRSWLSGENKSLEIVP